MSDKISCKAELLKRIHSQMASIIAEGFEFTEMDDKLIDNIVNGEISIDKAIEVIKNEHQR